MTRKRLWQRAPWAQPELKPPPRLDWSLNAAPTTSESGVDSEPVAARAPGPDVSSQPHAQPSTDSSPPSSSRAHDEVPQPYWDEKYRQQLVPASRLAPAPMVRRERRRDAGVLLLVLAVAAAIVVAFAVLNREPDGGAEPRAGGVATSPPTAEPGTSVPPPPVASLRGTVMTATVVDGDALDISEVVSWPDGGPPELTLELPDLGAVSGVDEQFDPVVSDLQITLDGEPVEVVADSDATSWSVQSADGLAPTTMEIRYLLEGAIVRSAPSEIGRGLAVLAPLSTNVSGSSPVRMELPGEEVLTIACPGASDVEGQLCGRQGGDRWTADIPAGPSAVAIVQLDLPSLV